MAVRLCELDKGGQVEVRAKRVRRYHDYSSMWIQGSNPTPSTRAFTTRDPDANTYCPIPQHVISAVLLPGGHPVCTMLASAKVKGYHLEIPPD